MSKLNGYRGYVGSRKYTCGEYPQFAQNLIIRNYCDKHKLNYLLSATEYCMPGCYMILQEVLDNIDLVDGIVLFSVFMLPLTKEKRLRMYDIILNKNKTLHAALEDLSIKNKNDIERVENILLLNDAAHTDETLNQLFSESYA